MKGKVDVTLITKGLDFDHVGLVAILQADQILHYPDSVSYTHLDVYKRQAYSRYAG